MSIDPAPESFVRQAPQKEGKGCFFYGCLITGVLAVLVVGVFLMGMMKLKNMMREYTSEAPVEIPTYQVQPGECEQLNARIESFKTDGGTLSLSADDLNAMTTCLEGMKDMAGKVWFKIPGGELTVDASFPLTGIPGFSGRYLNGNMTLDLYLRDGIPHAYLKDIATEGKEIPAEFIREIGKENLAKDLMSDPNLGPMLRELKSLEVEDGKLVLTK